MITFAVPISRDTYWRDARVAEEARLESVCTPKGYREFESRSLQGFFVNRGPKNVPKNEKLNKKKVLAGRHLSEKVFSE